MSTDPNAILYYGFRLENDFIDNLEEDYDNLNEVWELEFAPKRPHANPEHTRYDTPDWDEWREKNKIWEQSYQNIKISWSGTWECRTWYVECHSLQKQVEWNEQIELGRDFLLGAIPEADHYIEKFCSKFNIPYKRPCWNLACLYF